jgi:Helix-turn-helix domain
MKKNSHGLTDAVKEHLLTGNPITRLEALIFFGVSNLTDVISEMRKKGFVIQSQTVPFAKAVVRVNQHAKLETPANLPIREIVLTEYWIHR